MSILGSLGAAANGFVDGLERGQRMARHNAAMADEDRLRKAMKDADEAGRQSYLAWQKGQEPQPGLSSADVAAAPGFGKDLQVSVDQPATLGQGPGASGLSGQLSLGGQEPIGSQPGAQPRQSADDREGILMALGARRKALMKSGVDPKHWLGDWGKEANLRAEVRAERLDQANQRFAIDGDPGSWAKSVYPLIDDGMEFVSASPTKGVDGKEGWQFVRRDPDTGKEEISTMDADGFNRFRMSVADPKMVMQYEARKALAAYQNAKDIEKDEAGQKSRRARSLAEHGDRMAEIAARGSQDRQTNERKHVVLGPDATLVKPDGKGGASTVAKGGSRTLGGPAANPSAANKILMHREQATAAMAANPAAAAKIKERFRHLTGKDFDAK